MAEQTEPTNDLGRTAVEVITMAVMNPQTLDDGIEPAPADENLAQRVHDFLVVHGFDVVLHDRGLRVEVYRQLRPGASKFEPPTDGSFEHRWRVVHTSNGKILASGEGYVDKRDRDHAVQVLFPGVEVVEVEG